MMWGDRASDRYAAEVVEKKPSAGRWLGAIMDVISGSTPDATAEFEFRITDKRTGGVLLTEPFGGTAAQEALRLAEERLEQMTVAEFRDEYSLEESAES